MAALPAPWLTHQAVLASAVAIVSTTWANVARSVSAPPSTAGTSIRKKPASTIACTSAAGRRRSRSIWSAAAAIDGTSSRAASTSATGGPATSSLLLPDELRVPGAGCRVPGPRCRVPDPGLRGPTLRLCSGNGSEWSPPQGPRRARGNLGVPVWYRRRAQGEVIDIRGNRLSNPNPQPRTPNPPELAPNTRHPGTPPRV